MFTFGACTHAMKISFFKVRVQQKGPFIPQKKKTGCINKKKAPNQLEWFGSACVLTFSKARVFSWKRSIQRRGLTSRFVFSQISEGHPSKKQQLMMAEICDKYKKQTVEMGNLENSQPAVAVSSFDPQLEGPLKPAILSLPKKMEYFPMLSRNL